MTISGSHGPSQRRFRRRLALAAVAIGALAGLAMPAYGGGDGPRPGASWAIPAAPR